MVKHKKFIKVLIASFVFLCAGSSLAEARTVVDKISANGINIEVTDDGYFKIDSSLQGGRVLYFTRVGESEDSLHGDAYSSDVKFYDNLGKRVSERTDLGGQDKYTLSNYDNWLVWGYTIDVSDDSDFNQDEGEKIMQGNKVIDDFDGWLPCNYLDMESSYFEINAVYKYDNGSYSQPVTKVFLISKTNIDQALAPTLTVTEKERGSGYIKYILSCERNLNDDKLSNITIEGQNGFRDTVDVGDLSSLDYTIYKSGVYTFTLNSSNGRSSVVLVTVPAIDYNLDVGGTASQETKKPNLTFTGLPEKAILGDTVTVHVHSDVPCIVTYNGTKYEKQDIDIPLTENGNYTFTLLDSEGMTYDYTLRVTCFQDEKAEENLKSSNTSYWSSGKSSDKYDEAKLPQTGGVFYNISMTVGILCTITGVLIGTFIAINKRKGEQSNE